MEKKENTIQFEVILNTLLQNGIASPGSPVLKELVDQSNHQLISCYNDIDAMIRQKIESHGIESTCDHLEEEIDSITELNSQKQINSCLVAELDQLSTPDEMEGLFHEISDKIIECYKIINSDTKEEIRVKRRIPPYPEDGDEEDYDHPAMHFAQEMSSLEDLAQACVDRGIDDPDELIGEWADMADMAR
jgi:hypothetical protein